VECQPRILVVDDTPQNIRVMEAILGPRGYAITRASSGPEALFEIAAEPPDLVLLDIVMPGMNGLEVCRHLRADPATQMLPVVMITASGDQEKVTALEAGADDFVQKPFNQAELLARVASLVRIRTYQNTIQQQAVELAEWNRSLSQRVDEQVAEIERLSRLRRFLSPQVANLLVSAEGESLLESHRRQVAVVCCQLPGFAALADTSAPEEVLTVLHAYHQALGTVIFEFEGTVGPLVEDRLTVLFNDPLPTDDPAGQAVRLALAMREKMMELLQEWRRIGHSLDFSVGIDLGYATLGTIGFEGKTEYGAIGTVARLAGRLCDMACDQQILVSHRVRAATESIVSCTDLGEQAISGFARPVPIYAIRSTRGAAGGLPSIAPERGTSSLAGAGPLTEREREVVGLIVRGYTNREIADELVIAEGTAVRHVANILNKLSLHSRAQVAVWAVQQAQPAAR
jgi:DNA-binding NarL/FixJ family response regulator